MSNRSAVVADDGSTDDESHLDDVPDGAGCTGIWERLSEHRGERGGKPCDERPDDRRGERRSDPHSE